MQPKILIIGLRTAFTTPKMIATASRVSTLVIAVPPVREMPSSAVDAHSATAVTRVRTRNPIDHLLRADGVVSHRVTAEARIGAKSRTLARTGGDRARIDPTPDASGARWASWTRTSVPSWSASAARRPGGGNPGLAAELRLA